MNKMITDEESVKLLWTGGLDSTFQLLQLLLVQHKRVTPIYLIDAERRSTGVELLTMKSIKEYLLKEYPHIQGLLQPTLYFAVADISPDAEITEAFQSIRKETHIGDQYEWLARFCKEHGFTDMQLSIHARTQHDRAHFDLEQIVSESNDNSECVFRIDTKYNMMREYVVFRYFSFPLFNITKLEMFNIADKQGWSEIMGMTWFCHRPTRNIKPCGRCVPCLLALKEGFSWRIPVWNRMVSIFYRKLISPLKSLAKVILRRLRLLKCD